jgi:hypothetical protein
MNNSVVVKKLIECVTRTVVAFIVEDSELELDAAMRRFYTSQVFEKLQNADTGLYRESPGYVYDLFQNEQQNGKLTQQEI